MGGFMTLSKKICRQQFRHARLKLSKIQRQKKSQQISRRLAYLLRKQKGAIAFYEAMGSEVNLFPWAYVWLAKYPDRPLYVPHYLTFNRVMVFRPYPRYKKGKYLKAQQIRVLLMPLIAADLKGHRLGQGGGYYDATLKHCSKKKPYRLGIGFACQLTDQLPIESHDQRLNTFVSEEKLIQFSYKTVVSLTQ